MSYIFFFCLTLSQILFFEFVALLRVQHNANSMLHINVVMLLNRKKNMPLHFFLIITNFNPTKVVKLLVVMELRFNLKLTTLYVNKNIVIKPTRASFSSSSIKHFVQRILKERKMFTRCLPIHNKH